MPLFDPFAPPRNKARLSLPSRILDLPKPSNEVFKLLASPHISLTSLSGSPDLHPTLEEAKIVESRVYIQRGAPIAPHRKIALKVEERGGHCSWVILERKPTSRARLALGFGTTPANDRVGLLFLPHYLLAPLTFALTG